MFGSTTALFTGLVALAGIHQSLAVPIKGIDRATIQEDYDFIIAGGALPQDSTTRQ